MEMHKRQQKRRRKTTDSEEDTKGREESITDKDTNRTLDPFALTPPIQEPNVGPFGFYRPPSLIRGYTPEQYNVPLDLSSLKEETPASTTCESPFYRSVDRTTPGFLPTLPYRVQTPPSTSTDLLLVIESGSLENHVTPGFVSTSPYHAQTPPSTSTDLLPVIESGSLENHVTPGFVSTSPYHAQTPPSTSTDLLPVIKYVSLENCAKPGFVSTSLNDLQPQASTSTNIEHYPYVSLTSVSSAILVPPRCLLSCYDEPIPTSTSTTLACNVFPHAHSLEKCVPTNETEQSMKLESLQDSTFSSSNVASSTVHFSTLTPPDSQHKDINLHGNISTCKPERQKRKKIWSESLREHILSTSDSTVSDHLQPKSVICPTLPPLTCGKVDGPLLKLEDEMVLQSPTVFNQPWSGEESFHRSAVFPESPSFLLSDSLNLHQGRKPKYIKKQTTEVTDDRGQTISRSTHTAHLPCSQFSISPLTGPSECSNESLLTFEEILFQTENIQGVDPNVSGEADPPVITERLSVTHILPPNFHLYSCSTDSCCLTRSHSLSSLSKVPKKNLTRAASLPEMRLKEFTPDITADESDDETYLLQCSCAGLYQCSVTGLVFVMQGEGDVVYRTVPWNRRLLAQHHKKPAGPLFDIKCQQQSVCQLHLPHCELISTGGGQFLQVAHVNDEGIEFITPQRITESHVVINITGFSGYGNVKDEDSPPDPVQALVLLFYKPPDYPDLTSFLNVLLLPKNIVLRDVLHTRKKLVGDERYIETSPHCKLHPKQVYTLSAVPEDDSVLVQPTEAEFDEESYDNYFPSFQVILDKILKTIKLTLSDSTSSHSVWQRQVYLSSSGVKKCRESVPWNLSPNERLFNVQSCFIDGISAPVLKSLLDKLLEKKVIIDAEMEEAHDMQSRSNRARFVIDTVRKKGEAASSQMIELLSELDSFFCKSLGLI